MTLAYRYDDPGFGPGTISYVASLGALYALAVRAAELAGRDAARAGDCQADAATATIEAAGPVAERLAGELPDGAKVDFVGGGPSLGTAFFGRAKMIEAAHCAGRSARARGVGARGVLLHRPRGDDDRRRAARRFARPRRRAARRRTGDRRDGRRRLPARIARLLPRPTIVLPVAGDHRRGAVSPLTYCVPLELLAYHYASTRGLTMLGFDEEWRRR